MAKEYEISAVGLGKMCVRLQDGPIQSNLVQLTLEDLQKPLKKYQYFPTLSRKAQDVRKSNAQAERAAKIIDALSMIQCAKDFPAMILNPRTSEKVLFRKPGT